MEIIFKPSYFLYPSLVSPAFKGGREPYPRNLGGKTLPGHHGPQHENVRIHVTSALHGGIEVEGKGSPYPAYLIRRDRHADTRAAHEDTAFNLSSGDKAGDFCRIVGIIDRIEAVCPDIDHVMLPRQHLHQIGFQLVAGVVRSDGDSHLLEPLENKD